MPMLYPDLGSFVTPHRLQKTTISTASKLGSLQRQGEPLWSFLKIIYQSRLDFVGISGIFHMFLFSRGGEERRARQGQMRIEGRSGGFFCCGKRVGETLNIFYREPKFLSSKGSGAGDVDNQCT